MPTALPSTTRLGPVTLGVADLERSLGFYRDLVRLSVLERDGSRVTLGVGDIAVIHLGEEPGAQPAPPGHVGLREIVIDAPGVNAREFVDPWGLRVIVRAKE